MVTNDSTIPKPPVPLILSGWIFSNDVDKKLRWEEMKSWAEQYGVSGLMPELKPDDWYSVVKLDDSNPNPYRNWNYKERTKPSEKEVLNLFEKIERTWEVIVGKKFAEITWPVRFTGKKFRRLLIVVDKNAVPPWGSWQSLSKIESERRSFTDFRKRINAAIHPHEVDHIDFITKEKNMEHSVFIKDVEILLSKNDQNLWEYCCKFCSSGKQDETIFEERILLHFGTRLDAYEHAIEYIDKLETIAMNMELQEELYKNRNLDLKDFLDFI